MLFEVCLISHHEGLVLGTEGFDRVRRCASYVSLEEHVHLGEQLMKTTDLFTVAGMAVLIHADQEMLQREPWKPR